MGTYAYLFTHLLICSPRYIIIIIIFKRSQLSTLRSRSQNCRRVHTTNQYPIFGHVPQHTVDFFSLDHLGFVSSMCNYCVSVIIGIMTLILINLCWGYCTFSAQSAITLLSHMSMMNVWMSSSMSVSSWRHCMLPRLKSEKNVGENCFCWERSQIKMDLKRMSWF